MAALSKYQSRLSNLFAPSFARFKTFDGVRAVSDNAPGQLRVLHRVRYVKHVNNVYKPTDEKVKEELSAALAKIEPNVFELIVQSGSVISSAWLFVWPLIVTGMIMCKFASSSPPGCDESIFPMTKEAVLDAAAEGFVIIEGPKGTGKTTFCQWLSSRVSCPIFIVVEESAANPNDVKGLLCARFGLMWPQMSAVFSLLNRFGLKPFIFIDIQCGGIDASRLQKSIRSLTDGKAIAHVVVCASEGQMFRNTTAEPRRTVLQSEELSMENMKTRLVGLPMGKLSPEKLENALKKMPCTHLLLHNLARATDAEAAVKSIEAKFIDEIKEPTQEAFDQCPGKKELFERLSSGQAMEWVAIRKLCKDVFTGKQDFIDAAVKTNIMRPVGTSYFAPQFGATSLAMKELMKGK